MRRRLLTSMAWRGAARFRAASADRLHLAPSRTASLGLTTTCWPSSRPESTSRRSPKSRPSWMRAKCTRAVGLHHRHLRPVAAHHQGVAGNQQRRIVAAAPRGPPARTCPGISSAVRVGHLHLHQQRAGGGVERIGGAGHRAGELAARQIGDRRARPAAPRARTAASACGTFR